MRLRLSIFAALLISANVFAQAQGTRSTAVLCNIPPPQLIVQTGFTISGAGDSSINGVYEQTGVDATYFKPSYSLVGTSSSEILSVIWEDADPFINPDSGTGWKIYNDVHNVVYRSIDAVAYPWQVTTWLRTSLANPGAAPVPSFNFPALHRYIGGEMKVQEHWEIIPIEVADAAARLALPSGTAVGTKVHQVDNDTIYQLIALDAITLSGSSVNGTYTKRGTNDGKSYYNLAGYSESEFGLGDVGANSIVWSNSAVTGPPFIPNGWAIFLSGGDSGYTSGIEDLLVGLPAVLVDDEAGRVRIREGNAGIDLTITFNSAQTLAQSGNVDDAADAGISIGTSDSPTRTQIAAKIAALAVFPVFSTGLSATSSGEQVTFHQRLAGHMGQFFTDNEGSWTLVSLTYTTDNTATPDLVAGASWFDAQNAEPASITLTPGTYTNVASEGNWQPLP